MDVLFAMSLPGLVLLLAVVGAVEVVLVRRRRRLGHADAKPVVSGVGFDALGIALSPGRQHQQEHDELMEVMRDEEGDAAPPRSTVDLDSGTARIVLPPAG
jgi:hypothetical protein